LVVHEQGGVVASGLQAEGLCFGTRVEEADGDAFELWCRRDRGDLYGCNRVTTKQEMTTLTLKLNRTLHSQFRRPLPPNEVLGPWIGVEMPQFGRLDLNSELRLE
jgi:hypothetical protein